MAISLVASTRGIAILPASIVSRPLHGEQPAIDLVPAFHKANKSPTLEKFLSRMGDLAAEVADRNRVS